MKEGCWQEDGEWKEDGEMEHVAEHIADHDSNFYKLIVYQVKYYSLLFWIDH